MKLIKSPAGYYHFEIPNNWSYEVEDNLISVWDEEGGVGALQISSFLISKDYSMNLKMELAEFIQERTSKELDFILDNISYFEKTNTVSMQLIKEGDFWKYQMMFQKDILLFITYNCTEENMHTEEEIVGDIIGSIVISGN